jgi:hypothetical protein
MDAHERKVDIQPVIDWLVEGAKPATEAKHALSLLCARMLGCSNAACGWIASPCS